MSTPVFFKSNARLVSRQPVFTPVIIIGAARSGTNMLRDMLTQLPRVGTWPCDEINYIWRHFNSHIPHDEFLIEHASPRVARYIRREFIRMAAKTESHFLVEKTCANSLRVRFVDAVIPNARYLFLVRDGRDVVLSAIKRWRAKLDLRYLLKKLRFVPTGDLPLYALRYAHNRLYRLTSPEKRLATWGPRLIGFDNILSSHPLDEVCALQWLRSVQRSQEELLTISPDRVHLVRYEDIVADPVPHLEEISRFLGIEVPAETRKRLSGRVRRSSAGIWRRHMAAEQVERITKLIEPMLSSLGYQGADRTHIPSGNL